MTFARTLPLALLLLAACSRTDPPADKAASPPASAAAAAASSSPPAGSAAAAAASGASPAADAGPTATWKGSFKARPGAVTLDKEAAEAIKVWSKDPGTALVGDGTLTLAVSGGPRRVVRGEIEGALGPLVVNGEIDGNALRARVDPKDPNSADAMTGVLQGTFEGDSPEVTLRVASRNANIVREATFKLAK